MQGQESVPSVLEAEARGEIADIYADIRKVLGTSVVNLIWRNLATMPGALEWTWSTVRPLYLGDAPLHAEAVRQTIALPDWPGFSTDTLLAAGVDEVYCISVNDAFVMYQWGKHLGVKKVQLLPDGSADFTRRMGMLIRKDHVGFGERSWRYAMVVDDGLIKAWFEEPGINDEGLDDDPYGETRPERALEWVKTNPA